MIPVVVSSHAVKRATERLEMPDGCDVEAILIGLWTTGEPWKYQLGDDEGRVAVYHGHRYILFAGITGTGQSIKTIVTERHANRSWAITLRTHKYRSRKQKRRYRI